jgi:anti-sigma B factor antagonist
VDIRQRLVDSVAVLDLSGRLVLGDGEGHLRAAVGRCLREGVTKILLNCADVSYVDSSGLGEVVEAYVAATGRGGRLVLVGVSSRFRLLLATVGLLNVLEVRADVTAGLDSFRGPRPMAGRSGVAEDSGEGGLESWQPRRCQGVVLLSA